MKSKMIAKPKAPKKPIFWSNRPYKPVKQKVGEYRMTTIPSFGTVSSLVKWLKQFEGEMTKITSSYWGGTKYVEVRHDADSIKKQHQAEMKKYEKDLAKYKVKKEEFDVKQKQYEQDLEKYKKDMVRWNLQKAKVEWNKMVRKIGTK